MRIKETPIYKFDELSDRAKEKAREWYRRGNDDFCFSADWVLDDAKDVLKAFGYSDVKISYSGFWSQGDGASFTGNFYASDYDGNGTNAIQAMLVDRSTDKELARIAAELEAILLSAPNLSASISRHGHYCHEMSTRFEFDFGDDYEANDALDMEALENRFKEVSRDLMRWIYSYLEKEYEFQNSDEVIDENIAANDYEFTEDGKPA